MKMVEKWILIFLIFTSISFAEIQVNIVQIPPGSPIPQDVQLNLQITPVCISDPCTSFAQSFDIKIHYGNGQITEENVIRGQTLDDYQYLCIDYPQECPDSQSPFFTIDVLALDVNSNPIDSPTQSEQRVEFIADNLPPIVKLQPEPRIDGQKIVIDYRINPQDDDFNQHTIHMDIGSEQIQAQQEILKPFTPPWQEMMPPTQQGEWYVGAVSYDCPGTCQLPININLIAVDPQGLSAIDTKTIMQSTSPQISVQGAYDQNKNEVNAVILVTDDDIPLQWKFSELSSEIKIDNQNPITITKQMLDGTDSPPSIINSIERQEAQNSYKYQLNIDCTDCNQKVLIGAHITDSDQNSADGQKEIEVGGLMAPDSAQIDPKYPKEGESFTIQVFQPKTSDKIDGHEFDFYKLVWDKNLQDYKKVSISSKQGVWVPADQPGKLSSTYTYSCSGECEGMIGADVRAKKGQQYSSLWMMKPSVTFRVEAPNQPILVAATPTEMYPRLKEYKTDFIGPKQTATLKIGPAPDGVKTDKIQIKIIRNSQQISTFEQDTAKGDAQVTVDCTSLKCEHRDTIKVVATPYVKNTAGKQLVLTLTVYDESLDQPPGLSAVCDDVTGKSINIMAAGLLAMAFVIGLVYMAGESLNIPKMIEWSKNEAVQLAMVPVIFIIIIWLVSSVCTIQMGELMNWAPGLLKGSVISEDASTMQAAQEQLDWGIAQTHLTVAMIRHDLGALDMRATHNNYENQGLGFGMNGYSFSDYSGDYTTAGTLTMLLNLNSGFMITLLFQYFSLVFFSASNGFFFLLLPIGLVMRSVPYLRAFGGGMVALAVGLFILYPLVLAMSGLILGPVYAQTDASDVYIQYYDNPRASVSKAIVDVESQEEAMTGEGPTTYIGEHPSPKVTNETYDEIKDLWVVNLSVFFRLTAQNFIRAVFIPSAALLVTVAMISNLAIVFGGEIDVSKLVQMV